MFVGGPQPLPKGGVQVVRKEVKKLRKLFGVVLLGTCLALSIAAAVVFSPTVVDAKSEHVMQAGGTTDADPDEFSVSRPAVLTPNAAGHVISDAHDRGGDADPDEFSVSRPGWLGLFGRWLTMHFGGLLRL